MSINELETHPYLFKQITDFTDKNNQSKYCKLIVGTFPIYAITDSVPVEELGRQKRTNWREEAYLKYFYGSKGSHMWRLFCNTFNEAFPENEQGVIDLLYKYKFLITDVYCKSARKKYSSSDADIRRKTLNQGIVDIVSNAKNIKVVYFTSKEAKRIFCEILQIDCIDQNDNEEIINRQTYRMITLISPGGNPRRAPDFFQSFPLLEEEEFLRNNGERYALTYRNRYYNYYLSLLGQ